MIAEHVFVHELGHARQPDKIYKKGDCKLQSRFEMALE